MALRFPRQAQFHPLKYLNALARAIMRDGGRIFSQTHATKIEGGDEARIETSHGPVVTSEVVVVAKNTPVNDRVAIHTKQAPYVTYVIGVVGFRTKDLVFWEQKFAAVCDELTRYGSLPVCDVPRVRLTVDLRFDAAARQESEAGIVIGFHRIAAAARARCGWARRWR